MDELRVNNKVKMKSRDGIILNGVVQNYIDDRVLIKIFQSDSENLKKINALDDFFVVVETDFGIKKMISSTIGANYLKNEITIENNKAMYVEQKREFVRISADFDLEIQDKNKNPYDCKCVNISAGGISFIIKDQGQEPLFNVADDILIKFKKEIFTKNFDCHAQIFKIKNNRYVALYNKINKHNQSLITKYVFKLTSKNKQGKHFGKH